MKGVGYALLVLAALICLVTYLDWREGEITVMEPSGSHHETTIAKEDDPEGFSHALIYNLMFAGMLGGAGLLALRMIRRADQLDPLSPHFTGKSSFDCFGKDPQKK